MTAPLSWLYGALVSLRNRRYDRDPGASTKLPAVVVSVGNLTVGGSGKTPFVAALARALLGRGERVAVLSRGYGRRSRSGFVLVSDGRTIQGTVEDCGDEPLELARGVEGLTVVVGPDRAAAGRELLEKLGPHVLLLDDGFQHRRLRRDLDLVCFDAREPIETLRLLPRGRLREPLAEPLARACHRLDRVARRRATRRAPRSRDAGGAPAPFDSNREPAPRLLTGRTGRSGSTPRGLRAQPVGVLLGVARPERVLETIPARVVYSATRRDHHWWGAEEVRSLAEEAKRKGAVALVTTGKDAVKMSGAAPSLPLYALRSETEILDRSALEALLEPLFQRSGNGAIL